MLEELPLDPTKSSNVVFLHEERTPAWLVRLACAAHASAASLAECRDLLAWFGVDRTRQAVWYWMQAYGEHHDDEFVAEPDRVAVDEKQVQLGSGEEIWLYAAIDLDSKVVLQARLSKHRGTDPAAEFLRELTEKHRVGDAVFLVDGMGWDGIPDSPRPDTSCWRSQLHRPQHRGEAVPDVQDANRAVS